MGPPQGQFPPVGLVGERPAHLVHRAGESVEFIYPERAGRLGEQAGPDGVDGPDESAQGSGDDPVDERVDAQRQRGPEHQEADRADDDLPPDLPADVVQALGDVDGRARFRVDARHKVRAPVGRPPLRRRGRRSDRRRDLVRLQ